MALTTSFIATFVTVSVTFQSATISADEPPNALVQPPPWFLRMAIVEGNQYVRYCTTVLVHLNFVLVPNDGCTLSIGLNGVTAVVVIDGHNYTTTERWPIEELFVLHKLDRSAPASRPLALINSRESVVKQGYSAFYERKEGILEIKRTVLLPAVTSCVLNPNSNEFYEQGDAPLGSVYYSYKNGVYTMHGICNGGKATCFGYSSCYEKIRIYGVHIRQAIKSMLYVDGRIQQRLTQHQLKV